MFRYSNVAATIAVFIALGGVSYAAVTVPRNSVGSPQVRDGSLRVRDLDRRHKTLRLAGKPTSAHLVDNDPAGNSQGDMLVFTSDILNQSGRRIGENQGYCVEVEAGGFGPTSGGGSATCTEVFALSHGEIHIVGTTGAGSGDAVVVGGTGAYAGATGTVTPGQPANGLFPNTIRLSIPR